MSLWLLLVALSLGEPGDWVEPGDDALPVPMDPALTEIWLRGLALQDGGDPIAASAAFRIVVRSAPAWVPGLLALGGAYESTDRLDDALDIYGRNSVPDVLLARARVQLALDQPHQALRTYVRLRRSAPSAEVVRLQAEAESRVDAEAAAERLREWLVWLRDAPSVGMGAEPVDPSVEAETVLHVVDALLAADRAEDATQLLGDVLTQHPSLSDIPELSQRFDALLLDAEARQWMRSGAVELDVEQTRRLRAIETDLRSGAYQRAEEAVNQLVLEASRSPDAWATRARVALAQGAIRTADDALQRAVFLAPTDPNYAAALADLLATSYAGREDAAAVEAYARALRRDPLWAELWWRMARVEQRSGLGDRGRAGFLRYVELEPEGEHAAAAGRLLMALERERPPEPPLPAEPEPPEGVSYEALLAYHRVGVLRARGEREAALAEVRRVRALAPDFADVVNLEASLFLDVGDRDHAIGAYEQSLRMNPSQPGVVLTLWDLLRREGREEEAERVIDGAISRGIGDVHYLVARAAWDENRPREASTQLTAFEGSARTGRFAEEARELRTLIHEREQRLWTIGGAVSALLALLLALWPVSRWLRGPGVDLSTFGESTPGAARSVVRLAAAIRHEVLKHDTTVLFEVADAIEGGDSDPSKWVADRLFAPRGTVARFREHIDGLQALARTHGVRLDLRRKDTVFSPLIGAIDRLVALRSDLQRGRSRVVPELRRVAYALNEVGFSDLGRLVQSLSLIRVDADTVDSVVQRVRTEASLKGAPDVVVTVTDDAVWVRLFRGELEDILANLVRNSLAASRDYDSGDIAVVVDVEVDDMTFLERLRIGVYDRIPAPLTTADIRERPMERGLGLVRDLVDTNGGTIHVEPAKGWNKVVIVRLPIVETLEVTE